jgi:hypothetical protein
MEANKQVNKDEVIQQLQNRSKELQNKIAHQKLHKLAIRRAAGIETNRAIFAIDKNKRKYIIKDNGEELEMPYRSLNLKIKCDEPLGVLAFLLSTFHLRLLDHEGKEYNPFLSKSAAIEMMEKKRFCVADRDGHIYHFQKGLGYIVKGELIPDLPESEFIPESVLLRFQQVEQEEI